MDTDLRSRSNESLLTVLVEALRAGFARRLRYKSAYSPKSGGQRRDALVVTTGVVRLKTSSGTTQ